MNRVAVFIDGWFMRKRIMSLRTFDYTAENIRKYCWLHLHDISKNGAIRLIRIFYYDTEPLQNLGHNPISKKTINFAKTDVAKSQSDLLDSIRITPSMALRLGRTHWRNNAWILSNEKLKLLLDGKIAISDLEENDVKPAIEQKAVDMKMGIDITSHAIKRLIDTLIIISGDSDIVPALKLARREGIIVRLDSLWGNVHSDLKEHTDYLKTMFRKEEQLWKGDKTAFDILYQPQ
jgi:uncharacterized LabA/DUF88 family protein